jgi:hypothetical protein
MNYSVVRVPVHPVTKKYFEMRYASRMDERGYMEMDKNSGFGKKIIICLDNWWPTWEIPVVDGPFLKIKLPKMYARYGIPKKKLKELGDILDCDAMDALVMQIAFGYSFPGVSVTEAILIIMTWHNINDDEYRSDSMRRHFDRYCEEVIGLPYKEFSHIINSKVKVIYEKLVAKGKKIEDLLPHGH